MNTPLLAKEPVEKASVTILAVVAFVTLGEYLVKRLSRNGCLHGFFHHRVCLVLAKSMSYDFAHSATTSLSPLSRQPLKDGALSRGKNPPPSKRHLRRQQQPALRTINQRSCRRGGGAHIQRAVECVVQVHIYAQIAPGNGAVPE